ncbi:MULTISPECIES: glutamine synthetase III [Breznakia]|uniref:Glutamine synthetase n=1 Tax=Breznakia blatticola TaxID=1754012 RepID=A0A4R8A2N4_9FIRM|nr:MULTISPECIES: glutamine synthetase III [Breznakia]MDH6367110.1 glutamine synthetase [Breznakia sp. PH1-1]MDH6404303.1 glutamine synthetase [Breznakia sp. PF1-11]MDH6411997.1 glutamine synthetase [Breznakia sp. PFB1-11]MDH6414291.1 glutamine synthetase [Breznakia sp. PFB1-14]MDH6416611.1 glutamine synthetase [Breznakia sp. PFB1-4]
MRTNVTEIFGSKVFDDRCMKAKLPKDIYKKYKATIEEGKPLDPECASTIATAMKDWAIENGATHYTHWFQPMTGITAEKHDAFITPSGDGSIIMEFSGKELIKGEPDASSFPNGGLRDTYEARGYTGWDPTSCVFIKEGILCIPSVFMSYNGESLDKKTPLLKSQELLNRQALRILKLFGKTDVKRVNTTVGAEQEYFLIDKNLWDKRKDLIYTGRTLYGARPPKTQELDDHYFGVLKPKVARFMDDLNVELWKLGVLAKTQHNEVAPAQHELAPIFTLTNVATDQNQLTMEIMKKVALRHGLVCLLHEKPFAGINGSGKHNNWSMATDQGENLLEPGATPEENAQFLLVLAALVKAVDENQDLLRISVASAGNDHRLGAQEAPPAIISIFTGTDLEAIIECIIEDKPQCNHSAGKIEIGVDSLPEFKKDNTDRNRTSPFAFTGNKFEFRMLGSQLSISCPNIMLNTIVAQAFKEFADRLEASSDLQKDLHDLIKETFTKHKRIIFNGNGYDDSWVVEAQNRGLLNLRTTYEALPHYMDAKNVELFTSNHIYTVNEMKARMDVLIEEYSKAINIEAETMVNMAKKNIIPSVLKYIKDLSETVAVKKSIVADLDCITEEAMIKKLNKLIHEVYTKTELLADDIVAANGISDNIKNATYYGESVLAKMVDLRAVVDEIEQNCSKEYWPFPSYGDLLYSVAD